MSEFFFFYTISLRAIGLLTASLCLSAYCVSKNKAFLLLTLFFLCSFLCGSLTFFGDYIGQNLQLTVDHFEIIRYPLEKLILGSAYPGLLWLLFCYHVDIKSLAATWSPVIGCYLGSAAALLFLPSGSIQKMAFYGSRWMVFLIICLVGAIYYLREQNPLVRLRLKRFRSLGFFFSVLTVCGIVYDYFFLFVVDQHTLGENLLYFADRNFPEEVLLQIVLPVYASREAWRLLKLRFHELPDVQQGNTRAHIDAALPFYSNKHKLSRREQEVLRLILLGKDNSAIAQDCYITSGTVKVHVNHILRKTGQTTRSDLIHDFWQQA